MTGHVPDSLEFSTAGGWVSTNASGMKKNLYGNIDDMLVNVKIVTPTGVFEKPHNNSRTSSGPDILRMILGSEGNFGIITEIVLRVRPLYEARIYQSIIFPDFDHGLAFMNEMGHSGCWPASVRTVDNLQFKFGYAMKIPHKGFMKKIDQASDRFVCIQSKG